MAKEIMHWADNTAKRIIGEKGDKPSYCIAAGITPSGRIHIGNFREIITVDLIKRALESLGKEVRFIYSWDDYDVFRKVPVDMPDQDYLKKFLRRAISEVPDTMDCKHESYALHNEKAVEEVLPLVDIHPEYIYQHTKYKGCHYAELMKTAMQNKDKIKEILDQFRKEPLASNWWPTAIFCEECKKDDVKIINYDGEYDVSYVCECGFEDTFDIREKGIIKLLWRVDWPARWSFERVDFESGGKDHFAAGGSFDTAKDIVKLYDYEAPTSIRYECIGIKGGKQFSSSSGDVTTVQDVLQIYEPAIVRFLFAGTRPEAEFDISFDLDVLKIYEDFDKCERIYFKEQEASEKNYQKQKRIYELSALSIPEKMPFQPGFRHLTTLLQIHGLDIDATLKSYELEDEKDREKLKLRAGCVKNWLEIYAPEDFKFSVQEEVASDVNLTDAQKGALKKVASLLDTIEDDKALHNAFYDICKEQELEVRDFFTAAYQVLIHREKGPKLASFIFTIGKEKVKKLFSSF